MMAVLTASEVTELILAAVNSVPGLRPAMLISQQNASWIPWDWEGSAVTLEPELVQVRVIALCLPLPPLLEQAGTAVRPALAGTPWEIAKLRLVVTDVDGAAFSPG
jgi:hypothetical protein